MTTGSGRGGRTHPLGHRRASAARSAGSSASARRALPSANARIGIDDPGAGWRRTTRRCLGAGGVGEHRCTYATDRGVRSRPWPSSARARGAPPSPRSCSEHAPTDALGSQPRAGRRDRDTGTRTRSTSPGIALPDAAGDHATSTPRARRGRRGDGGAVARLPRRCSSWRPRDSRPTCPVVSLAKGIERGTLLRMTEVILDVLAGHDPGTGRGAHRAEPGARGRRGAAGGVGDRVPRRRRPRAELQQLFMTDSFRVYTNPDVVGCEIAGALKNVIAIAAGTAAGLGYGDNTQAALITRGLAEVARLGVALGGEPLTFAGLAGLGDLVATCTSAKSRNRSVGLRARAGPLARRDRRGDRTWWPRACGAPPRCSSSRRGSGVEMPIASMVGAVLYDGRRPADLVPELMLREAKAELHGSRDRSRDRIRSAAERSIGVLGGARDATVDRAGVVRPERAGWELDWWIGADDRWHVPGREAAVRQTLVDGMPVVQTSMRVPGGDAVHARVRRSRADAAGRGRRDRQRVARAVRGRARGARRERGRPRRRRRCSSTGAARCARRARPRGGRWPRTAATEESVTRRGVATAPFAPRRDRAARARGGVPLPGRAPDHAARRRGRDRHAWARRDRAGRVARRGGGGAGMAARSSTGACGSSCPTTRCSARSTPRGRRRARGAGVEGRCPRSSRRSRTGASTRRPRGAWARLTGRERRRLATATRRRRPRVGRGARPGSRDDRRPARSRPCARCWCARTDDAVDRCSATGRPNGSGSPIDVRDAPTRRGPVSYSVRWHGDRPALLWEVPAGVRVHARPGSIPPGRRASAG